MPPVYGGAPKCPTCAKSVYAAEQILGPAGTYHKLCLKCVACGKLLEPRLLVDHDGQAYCKSCYSRSYGTKGYGAGGALVGEYAPRPRPSPPPPAPLVPPRPVAGTASPAAPASPAPPALPTRQPAALPASSNASQPPAPAPSAPAPVRAPAVPARPAPPPKPASIPRRTGGAEPTPPASEDVPPRTAPASKPSTPAFDDDNDDDDQRGPLAPSADRSSLATSSALASSLAALSIPTRSRSSLSSAAPSYANLPSLCPSCAKPAYHAERVQALGRAWHRACLRCSACATGLGSQPGRVEERDGKPWCKRCYQERWGITGGMGMSTR
ncbi:hypothetical protein JCM3770_005964 [Rhodotorula araucariae]